MTNDTTAASVAAIYDDATGAALIAALAPDVLWHFPGTSWLAGTHRGVGGVARLFMTMAVFTDHTFKVVPLHILADDEYAVSIVEASATFRGRSFSSTVAVVWRFEDGRVVEVREHPFDVAALDELFAGERPDDW